MDDRLPYSLATTIYKQGMECDNAARLIRKRLPQFFEDIKDQVKQDMGKDYKLEWER